MRDHIQSDSIYMITQKCQILTGISSVVTGISSVIAKASELGKGIAADGHRAMFGGGRV